MILRKKKLPTSEASNAKEGTLRNLTHVYGNMSGIDIGDSWQTRQALSDSWVHRPKAASLHAGSEGVYSILINKKYRGEDNGLTVIYSGPKIKSKGSNGLYCDSLIKNFKSKTPLRIVRGANRNSPFAPSSGFRFDGLYVVEKYCKDKDHMHFYLRRLSHQDVPPWIRRVPKRASAPIVKTVQRNGDEYKYKSFIRCQSRSLTEDNLSRREWTLNYDVRRIASSLNDSTVESTASGKSNSSKTLVAEIFKNTSSFINLESSAIPETPEQIQIKLSTSPNEMPPAAQKMSSSPLEGQNSDAKAPSLRGGMPLPKILDILKEESKSSVVMETLPQQDIYEICDEHVMYQEEAHITEVSSEDEDWEEEEIEIDSKIIQHVGDSQIVTAVSLSQEHHLLSQTQRCETPDIDVEDGPKFGHTIENSQTLGFGIVPCTEPCVVKQHTYLPTIIKTDHEVSESDEPRELIQPIDSSKLLQQEIENNGGDCLYIFPNTKWKSVVEAEQAISKGEFHWYQGNMPIQDPSKLTCSQREFDKMTMQASQPNVSKEVGVNEENIELGNHCDGSYPQKLNSYNKQKPDSTSNVAVDNLSIQCASKDGCCPFNSITIGDIMAYTFNEPRRDCYCIYKNRLPTMNYCIQCILQEKECHRKTLQEKDTKRIMARQSEESEEIMGTISHVQTVDTNTWNNVEHMDEARSSQDTIPEAYNNIQHNIDQEMNSSDVEHIHIHGVVPQPITLNTQNGSITLERIKHVEICWRGMEEVRDEAIQRVCSMPQPMISNNIDGSVKETDVENTEELDEKVTTMPQVYNERKEMIVQQHCRKRKLGTAMVDNEGGQSSTVSEVSPPTKLRMVHLRNIRTEINCTRILQVNNSQLCSSEASDKETENDFVKSSQESQNVDQFIDQLLEGDINSRSSENCSDSVQLYPATLGYDQNCSPSVDGTVTFEQACDELCEEMHLKKQEDMKQLDSLKNANLLSPYPVNELEKEYVRRRGQQNVKSQETSPVTSVSSGTDCLAVNEQKTRVAARPLALTINSLTTAVEENNLAVNPHNEDSFSPDSDTTSFERACDELCEVLPKTEGDYLIPTPASLSRRSLPLKTSCQPVGNSSETSKVLDGELIVKKRGRPRVRSQTPIKETEIQSQSPSSPSVHDSPESSNDSRNLKGFTYDDLCKIRQLKEMFDLVITECRNSDKSPKSIPSKTKSDSEKRVPMRAKSSRPKQKARRFEL